MSAAAVCRDRRDNFELLERAVTLAGPRVNQRQVGNHARAVERVLGNRHKIDRTPCLADRFFFSAKPSIKYRDVARSTLHPWACRPCRASSFSRARLQTPPAPSAYRRAHAQPVRQPNSGGPPKVIRRILRRSSGNHPIRRVVISQVKRCHESDVPDLFSSD